MNLEFLTELGISEEVSGQIMQKYNSERLEAALEQGLKAEQVQDFSAAVALLKDKEITHENLGERISELKNEHPALFAIPVPKIVSSAGAKELDADEFKKMSYRERLELYKQKPELYKKLVK